MISESIGKPNTKPLAQTLSSKTLAIHKNKSESIGVLFQIPLADQMGNHWLRPLVRNHWQFTNTIQNPLAHKFRIHWQTKCETIGTDPQFENIGNPQIQFRIHWHTKCETFGMILNTRQNITKLKMISISMACHHSSTLAHHDR